MFKPLHFAALTASQFLDFLFRIINLVIGADPTKLKLKKKSDLLNKVIGLLNDAFKREQFLKETKELEELDRRRDRAIRGLLKMLDGLSLNSDTAKATAANLLLTFIHNLSPTIDRDDYSSESAELRKLTDANKTAGDIQNAINFLGLQDWLKEIEVANTAFEDKYQARTQVLSVTSNKESFSSLRPSAITAYKDLLTIIESRYHVAIDDGLDASEYKVLIDQIITTITQTEQIIASTKPHTKPATTPTTPPTTPTI